MSYSYLKRIRENSKPRTSGRHPEMAILRNYATGVEDAERTYRSLIGLGKPSNMFSAGRFALEMASEPGVIEAKAKWLNRAQTSFNTTLERLNIDPDITTPIHQAIGGLALIELAQLPNHSATCASGKLPSARVAEKAYANSIAPALRLALGHEQVMAAGDIETRNNLSGALGEAAALLLSQRYTLGEDTTDVWHPMFSFLSEDKHDWQGSTRHNAWDITVRTHYDDEPMPTYKVQVKNSMTPGNNGYSYNDNITLLYVKPDLQITGDREVSSNIIHELVREADGNLTATNRLNTRTEQLLNVLG